MTASAADLAATVEKALVVTDGLAQTGRQRERREAALPALAELERRAADRDRLAAALERLLILGSFGLDTSMMLDHKDDPNFLTDAWLDAWYEEGWRRDYITAELDAVSLPAREALTQKVAVAAEDADGEIYDPVNNSEKWKELYGQVRGERDELRKQLQELRKQLQQVQDHYDTPDYEGGVD